MRENHNSLFHEKNSECVRTDREADLRRME